MRCEQSQALRRSAIPCAVALALSGCGEAALESADGAPASSTAPQPSATQGYDPNAYGDVVPTPEQARSLVTFGRLGSVASRRPIVLAYEEGVSGEPAFIGLEYATNYPAFTALHLRAAYAGGRASVRIPTTAGVAVTEQPGDTLFYLNAVAGELNVVPTEAGIEIALTNVTMVRADSEEVVEEFGDGFISGELERSCLFLGRDPQSPVVDTVTGLPPLTLRRDADWSSTFCSRFRQ